MVQTLQDKIFLLIIFSIILFHFVMQVVIPTIYSQITEPQPVNAVTILENGTAITKTVIPQQSSVFSIFIMSLNGMVLPLIVAFTGIGLWLPFEAIRVWQFPDDPSTLIPVYVLWITSIAFIPLIVKYSKKIPLWQRGLYVYLIPFLIAGLGITYFTNFGA